MNNHSFTTYCRIAAKALIAILLIISTGKTMAQSCPASAPSTINSNPDTYYPSLDNTVIAGATSITLGASRYGTTPIASGDLLLIIQMQGAQINAANTSSYGSGVSGSSKGYLSNSAMTAGNMEYIVATSAVPLSGGTLTLMSGTVNSYKNSNYGTDGQYRYQVVRIGLFYDLTLNATISAPLWNGSTGGVIAITATHTLNLNGQTITAAGAGFRGGAGRQLGGGTGGVNTDLISMSTSNFNASKGEGIAGTPRYVNNNGVLLDNGASNEGYPGGSYAAGAPGNAGGGGTDGRPTANDQNSGGGGGSNGGSGGRGGNSWSTNLVTGGFPGATFAERTPSRFVMGGGGGAGTTNNGTGLPLQGFASSGAAGGGIVMITANTITGTGTIDVSGANGNTTASNDGTGGGGAGGSALIYANGGLSNVTVLAKGGSGGSNTGNGAPHGPGGSGGGGVIYSNGTINAASSVAPGAAGFTVTSSNNYGATVGTTGILVQNVTALQVPQQNLNCSVLALQTRTPTRSSARDLDANAVSVSPNPAKSSTATIKFSLKKAPTTAIKLRMLSVNGATVWQKEYKASAGQNTVTIDNLTSLPNGVYIILYYNEEISDNVKLIVNH